MPEAGRRSPHCIIETLSSYWGSFILFLLLYFSDFASRWHVVFGIKKVDIRNNYNFVDSGCDIIEPDD